MNALRKYAATVWAVIGLLTAPLSATAYALKQAGEAVQVADSGMTVTPSRDWNRLSGKIGKQTESWTLDGSQLNDATFYGGIEPGRPLVKERSSKHEPLPKFSESTLLVEVPELLEGTYRTYKELAAFNLAPPHPPSSSARTSSNSLMSSPIATGLRAKVAKADPPKGSPGSMRRSPIPMPGEIGLARGAVRRCEILARLFALSQTRSE